jgi:hypothetical protein
LRPSDFDREFCLRYSAVLDIIQHMRWRWWDEHDAALPGMASYPLNPDAVSSTGAVTRAVTIHAPNPQMLRSRVRTDRVTELRSRIMPGPVGKTSAAFLFEFYLRGSALPMLTASTVMVWIGGPQLKERSLLGRIVNRPAPVPQIVLDASQPAPPACVEGVLQVEELAAELDRVRGLSNAPSWSYELVNPALRLIDENANQHLSSATFMRLAEEAKFQMKITDTVVSVSMDIFSEARADNGGVGYVVRAALRSLRPKDLERGTALVPHIEWALFSQARDDLDNAEQMLTRVRMFLSEEKTAPIEPYSKL